MQSSISVIAAIVFGLVLSSCSSNESDKQTDSTSQNLPKATFSLKNSIEESKYSPDSMTILLHAQHHSFKVLGGALLSGPFKAPEMKHYADYAITFDQLPVINPGPGEHVHVMEGQRHGFNNLVIGITETFPGGYPPMHTHNGEEAHLLFEGEILYALGDTIFTMNGPFIVNIPPMVPHAFKNIGEETANLVVIFPTNIWEYNIVDYFPFESDTLTSRFEKFKSKLAKK